MFFDTFSSTLPIFFINLVLSTVLIWSSSTSPFLFSNFIFGLKIKSNPLLVMGATITVLRTFSSLGEMTMQGRVFWISDPTVGFNLTRYISNLLISATIRSHPDRCHREDLRGTLRLFCPYWLPERFWCFRPMSLSQYC